MINSNTSETDTESSPFLGLKSKIFGSQEMENVRVKRKHKHVSEPYNYSAHEDGLNKIRQFLNDFEQNYLNKYSESRNSCSQDHRAINKSSRDKSILTEASTNGKNNEDLFSKRKSFSEEVGIITNVEPFTSSRFDKFGNVKNIDCNALTDFDYATISRRTRKDRIFVTETQKTYTNNLEILKYVQNQKMDRNSINDVDVMSFNNSEISSANSQSEASLNLNKNTTFDSKIVFHKFSETKKRQVQPKITQYFKKLKAPFKKQNNEPLKSKQLTGANDPNSIFNKYSQNWVKYTETSSTRKVDHESERFLRKRSSSGCSFGSNTLRKSRSDPSKRIKLQHKKDDNWIEKFTENCSKSKGLGESIDATNKSRSGDWPNLFRKKASFDHSDAPNCRRNGFETQHTFKANRYDDDNREYLRRKDDSTSIVRQYSTFSYHTNESQKCETSERFLRKKSSSGSSFGSSTLRKSRFRKIKLQTKDPDSHKDDDWRALVQKYSNMRKSQTENCCKKSDELEANRKDLYHNRRRTERYANLNNRPLRLISFDNLPDFSTKNFTNNKHDTENCNDLYRKCSDFDNDMENVFHTQQSFKSNANRCQSETLKTQDETESSPIIRRRTITSNQYSASKENLILSTTAKSGTTDIKKNYYPVYSSTNTPSIQNVSSKQSNFNEHLPNDTGTVQTSTKAKEFKLFDVSVFTKPILPYCITSEEEQIVDNIESNNQTDQRSDHGQNNSFTFSNDYMAIDDTLTGGHIYTAESIKMSNLNTESPANAKTDDRPNYEIVDNCIIEDYTNIHNTVSIQNTQEDDLMKSDSSLFKRDTNNSQESQAVFTQPETFTQHYVDAESGSKKCLKSYYLTKNCLLYGENLLKELSMDKAKLDRLNEKHKRKRRASVESGEVLAKTYLKRYKKGNLKIFKLKRRLKVSPQLNYQPPEDGLIKRLNQRLANNLDDTIIEDLNDCESVVTSSSYQTDVTKLDLPSNNQDELTDPQRLLREGLDKLLKKRELVFSRYSHSCPKEIDPQDVLAKVTSIICQILRNYQQGKNLLFTYPRECMANCVFVNGRYQLKKSSIQSIISFKRNSLAKTCWFNLILFILNKIRTLLENGTKLTKRELYYQLKIIIKIQATTDRAIKVISRMLNIGSWALNLTAQKGLVYGNLKIIMQNGETVNCNVPGTMVPSDVTAISEIQAEAYFILVVEKESIFFKLIEERLSNRLTRPFILITGKGFPDHNTQLFLKKLWMVLTIPAFVLVDADPHGIAIMLNYRFGSMANAHLSEHLAIPEARWVGVFPSEIQNLSLTGAKMSDTEVKKTKQMLNLQCVIENEAIKEQLEILLNNRVKAGIESVMKTETFLSHRYLSWKFHKNEII